MAYCATLVRPSLLPTRKEKHQVKVGLSHLSSPSPATPDGDRMSLPWSFSYPYPVFETRDHRFIHRPYAQQLQLYESNAEPHIYATYIKYSRVGRSAADLLAPPGSSFEFAMTAFKRFFKIKTGMEWEKKDGWQATGAEEGRGRKSPA